MLLLLLTPVLSSSLESASHFNIANALTLLALLPAALGALGGSVVLKTMPSSVKTDGFGGGYWYTETSKNIKQTCS